MLRVLTIVLTTVVAVAVWRRRAAPPPLASALGRLLRNVRCGDKQLASNDPVLRDLPRFALASPAFSDGGQMAEAYVGIRGIQPPLSWTGVPAGTAELALIVEDIDVPVPAPFVHAVAYGIDPERAELPAGAIPPPGQADRHDPAVCVGRGTGGRAFLPPTPIPGHGPHRYVFQIFALRERLAFQRPPNKAQLVKALRTVATARATTIGTHEVA